MIQPRNLDEREPVTPRRLAIWDAELIGAGILVAAIYVIVYMTVSAESKPTWLVFIAWALWVAGAVLLLAAGIAKVIAIGVRSGSQ